MNKCPPEWAWARVRALRRAETALNAIEVAFARYIEEHEEPPVDPLLIEARQIASHARRKVNGSCDFGVADQILQGQWDDHQLVNAALTALRRGIELGKEHP